MFTAIVENVTLMRTFYLKKLQIFKMIVIKIGIRSYANNVIIYTENKSWYIGQTCWYILQTFLVKDADK